MHEAGASGLQLHMGEELLDTGWDEFVIVGEQSMPGMSGTYVTIAAELFDELRPAVSDSSVVSTVGATILEF